VAYTNAFFYSAHQLHDHVATVANMLLSSLVPLPMQHQDNCSRYASSHLNPLSVFKAMHRRPPGHRHCYSSVSIHRCHRF
jgi:hypothetical protein